MKTFLKWTGIIFAGIGLFLFLGYFFSLFRTPSNDRTWESGFEVLADGQFDQVAITDFRDWTWDENGSTSWNYKSETYNINELERAWFVISRFGPINGIAHTYMVFDFKDKDPIAVSIEARREKDEPYSMLLGLFNKYEIQYIWGAETDMTLHRVVTYDRDVFMYPIKLDPKATQQLFLMLVLDTRSLKFQPRWYNTLTDNCTNTFFHYANHIKSGSVPWNIAYLMPGWTDEMLYQYGYIDAPDGLTAKQLRESHYVSNWIRENWQDQQNFSTGLREYLQQQETITQE